MRFRSSVPIRRPGVRCCSWCSEAWFGLFGLQEPAGKRRLARPGAHPLRTLFASISIAWQEPKTAVGSIVRVINTAPQAIVYLFKPAVGVGGVMWIYAILYLASAGLTLRITLPPEEAKC